LPPHVGERQRLKSIAVRRRALVLYRQIPLSQKPNTQSIGLEQGDPDGNAHWNPLHTNPAQHS